MSAVRSLIHTWLVLDFFGDARRRGGTGSSLTTTIFTQSFLALVFAALLYPETPVIPFAAANLTLSSLLISVGLLGDEDRVGRRRADRVLVDPSPMRRSALVMARSGHAAFYVCLITIGMALPPAILLGFLRANWLIGAGYVVLACVCSGLCAGTLAVVMQFATRLLGSARASLLGGTLKALLLGGGLALFALGLQSLRGTVDDLPIGRLGAELLPTYQSARLLAHPIEEAWRLGALVAAGMALLVLASLVGQPDAERTAARRGTGPLRSLLHWSAGRGEDRATRTGIAEFVATMMWRSQGFRARVLPLLGLPAGMVYLSLRDGAGEKAFVFTCLLLQLPTIYLPFLIAFLPRADQENTRWVFDLAPPNRALVRDATWRALVTHVLLPVYLLAAAILVPGSETPLAMLVAVAFAAAVAVIVARPMCAGLAAVPFTEDGGAEPTTDLGTLFPFALGLLGAAVIYGEFLDDQLRTLATALAITAAFWLPVRKPSDAEAAPRERAEHATGAVTRSAASSETGEGSVPSPSPEVSLSRELRAITLLYAFVCVVPALIGLVFGDPGAGVG